MYDRWRARFLNRILEFRLSLLRERFSLRGFKECFVFSVLVVLLVVGCKAVICCVGGYNQTVLLMTVLFSLVAGSFIFPKKTEERCLAVKIFFDKVDVHSYKKYLFYRGYMYVQLIYLLLLFPLKQSGVDAFAVAFVLFEGYILLTVLVHHYSNSQVYNSYKWASSFLLCGLYFMNSRCYYIDMDELSLDYRMCFLLFSAGIAMAVISACKLGESIKGSVLRNVPDFLRGNKDMIYVLRSDCLLSPVVVTVFSGIVSYTLKETLDDMILTNLFSFFFMFTDVYISLLKYENKSYSIFYSGMGCSSFKKEKIKNTILIVVPVLLVLSVPLSFVTSFVSVAVSFALSLVMFLANAVFFRISIEKRNGYRVVFSEKDEYRILIVSVVELMIVCIIQMIVV